MHMTTDQCDSQRQRHVQHTSCGVCSQLSHGAERERERESRSDRLHQQQQQRTFHINAEVGWRLLVVPRDAPQLADLPLHLQRRQHALGRLRRLDTSERARRAGTRWRCSAGLQHLSTASVRQLGMGQSTFHRIPTRRTHACGMTNWRRACYGNTRTWSRYQPSSPRAGPHHPVCPGRRQVPAVSRMLVGADCLRATINLATNSGRDLVHVPFLSML
jgi:hypothetical protein